MNHINDDLILKYALETLDEKEVNFIENHFTDCDECRESLNEIQNEIDLICSFNPEMGETTFSIPKEKAKLNNWVKWVALLLIGFIAGYSTSSIIPKSRTTIVEQKLITHTPEISEIQFISCANVDLW